MTQPVSPDKPAGEALKALDPLYCSHPGPCEDNYRSNGGFFCANGDAFTPSPSALDDEVGKGPVSVSATPQTAVGAVLVWHSAEQLQRIEDKLDRLLTRLKDRS